MSIGSIRQKFTIAISLFVGRQEADAGAPAEMLDTVHRVALQAWRRLACIPRYNLASITFPSPAFWAILSSWKEPEKELLLAGFGRPNKEKKRIHG
jgi:hypothetical protein